LSVQDQCQVVSAGPAATVDDLLHLVGDVDALPAITDGVCVPVCVGAGTATVGDVVVGGRERAGVVRILTVHVDVDVVVG
jgi:hypothetical protein